MRKLLLAACLAVPAFALAACGPTAPPPAHASDPPATVAPLGNTTADEKAAVALLEGYDVFLGLVDVADAAGLLPPASARARQLADTIDFINGSLRSGLALLRAGNAASAATMIANASAAFANAKRLFYDGGG